MLPFSLGNGNSKWLKWMELGLRDHIWGCWFFLKNKQTKKPALPLHSAVLQMIWISFDQTRTSADTFLSIPYDSHRSNGCVYSVSAGTGVLLLYFFLLDQWLKFSFCIFSCKVYIHNDQILQEEWCDNWEWKTAAKSVCNSNTAVEYNAPRYLIRSHELYPLMVFLAGPQSPKSRTSVQKSGAAEEITSESKPMLNHKAYQRFHSEYLV